MRATAIRVCYDREQDGDDIAVPVPGALDGFATAPLIFPTLDKAPTEYTVLSNAQWWSNVAIQFLDAGVIDPDEVSTESINPSELARSYFSAWLAKRLGPLVYIGLKIVLSDTLDAAVGIELNAEAVAEHRRDPRLLDEQSLFFLSNLPRNWGFARIERGFLSLEEHTAGLGQTVWHHINNWLQCLRLNPVTPARTEEILINEEWYGEDDETELREQFESDKDFESSGCMTRARFDSLMPKIVVSPKAVLAWSDIKHLRASPTLPARHASLIDLVLNFSESIGIRPKSVFPSEGIESPDGDYIEQIAPAVFVRWNNDDPTVEIFDNMADRYQQGDERYYEGAEGFMCFPLTNTAAFKRWLPQADRYLRGVALLDKMLQNFEEHYQ